MSTGNYKASYVEEMHSLLIDEFHAYRNDNNLPVEFMIDGMMFAEIIVRAKAKLYANRPDAKQAGELEVVA